MSLWGSVRGWFRCNRKRPSYFGEQMSPQVQAENDCKSCLHWVDCTLNMVERLQSARSCVKSPIGDSNG